MAEGAGFDLPCGAGRVAALRRHRRLIHFRSRSNPALFMRKQSGTRPDCFRIGGGCRIRTRVGLRPNGFQDRPVMTASVTLRICELPLGRSAAIFRFQDRPVMSCCGARNLLLAVRSQDFDRGHSFLLASSTPGGARKRPRFGKPPFAVQKYHILRGMSSRDPTPAAARSSPKNSTKNLNCFWAGCLKSTEKRPLVLT